MGGAVTVYDMNGQGSFQCIAVAFTEKDRDKLENRGYQCFFTPEKDKTNCWILCRGGSEHCPSPT